MWSWMTNTVCVKPETEYVLRGDVSGNLLSRSPAYSSPFTRSSRIGAIMIINHDFLHISHQRLLTHPSHRRLSSPYFFRSGNGVSVSAFANRKPVTSLSAVLSPSYAFIPKALSTAHRPVLREYEPSSPSTPPSSNSCDNKNHYNFKHHASESCQRKGCEGRRR